MRLFDHHPSPARRNRIVTAVALVVGLLFQVAPAASEATDTPATHAYLIDTSTGTVLLEKAATEPMPPASMSKMMTVYMVFERLKDGSLKLDETLPVSEKAWKKGGSKMFVEVGTRVSVGDLLRGVIVQSGNDACIVIAEGLAGSEEAFAQRMTEKAREIGLEHSTFANATGWPDPGHMMSARDLAVVAERLRQDFPDYHELFGEQEFTYHDITQRNRNPLLGRVPGVDGLKTGHTEASGYGLTAAAEREGRRLVLVVNGLASERERARESERLLEWGFRNFEAYSLIRKGEPVEHADVWLGAAATVPLVLEEDLAVTLDRGARSEMKVTVSFEGPVPAPIRQGEQVGVLRVEAPGTPTIERPLLAGADVERLGVVGRLGAAIRHLVLGT